MIQNELMAIIYIIVCFASMCFLLCSICYHWGKSKGWQDGFQNGVKAERTVSLLKQKYGKIDKSNREEFEEIFKGLE